MLLHHPVGLFPCDDKPSNDIVWLQPESGQMNTVNRVPIVDTLVCNPSVFLLPLAFQSEGDVLLLKLGGSLP